ncbi:HNH endonuclease [Candidatus Saccharibacteria bacterium]|nr:HNH endonuclease [Candidatus Saccharibacteria bacterium]
MYNKSVYKSRFNQSHNMRYPVFTSQKTNNDDYPSINAEMAKRTIRRILASHQNNPTTKSDSPLSGADKEAWWDYIKTNHPDNYNLAEKYYDKKQDPNLRGQCVISDLTINEYFEIYGLPRVATKDGVIYVNDKPVRRYVGNEKYRFLRNVFYKAHDDKNFYSWKKNQFYICQNNRCAWCKKKCQLKDTQVDHIKPLLFFGDNCAENLVIACKKCNFNKSAHTKGWNDGRNQSKENQKPAWIKNNTYDNLMNKALVDAEAKVISKEQEDKIDRITVKLEEILF